MPDSAAEPEIVASDEQLAGAYANWTRIMTTEHEFTIDFVRLDPAAAFATGVLVARVAVSSHAFEELWRKIELSWNEYQRLVMPPEVGDDAV